MTQRNFIIIVIFFSLFFFGNAKFPTDLQAQVVLPSTEFVQAQGKNLMYKGSVVQLKGVNFDNVTAIGAGIGTNNVNNMTSTENDYKAISDLGGNHVRLGLSYTWYEQDKVQFFAKVDEQIAWARKHRVWVSLLTFTNPDGNDGCYEGYGNVCSIWTNQLYQQQLQDFWVNVAQRYSNNPVVVGYDLVNEPTPPAPNYCRTWFDLAQKLRNAVTDAAPKQLIFIESCSDPSFSRVFTEKDGVTKATNVIYEVHDYDPMAFTHPGYNPTTDKIKTYPGEATTWIDGVQKTLYFDKATFEGTRYPGVYSVEKKSALDWTIQNNVPHYVGEWGAQGWINGYAQYIADKAAVYNRLGISHAYYTWKHDVDGGWRWGITSRDGTKVDQAKMDAVKSSFAGAIKPQFDLQVCLGDFNSDKRIDIIDFTVLINNFFKQPLPNPVTDMNKDGKVDLFDFTLLQPLFFKSC